MTLEAEVQSLRQVPMFKDIDPSRLKLLAFTSERVQFAGGQRFFAQGDLSDAAYVILDGRANVLLNTPNGEIQVAELGGNALVGEMGILSDTPRSATITAAEPTTATLPAKVPLTPLPARRCAARITPVASGWGAE